MPQHARRAFALSHSERRNSYGIRGVFNCTDRSHYDIKTPANAERNRKCLPGPAQSTYRCHSNFRSNTRAKRLKSAEKSYDIFFRNKIILDSTLITLELRQCCLYRTCALRSLFFSFDLLCETCRTSALARYDA